ncbi:esterase/lipase family protein [Micromonospora sp. WMMD729]|uniref:esterase/lipase family protein n=1 Tax=Micromonospora sp. WMMD729 TaxID=3404127 RepID=UPI003BF4A0F2
MAFTGAFAVADEEPEDMDATLVTIHGFWSSPSTWDKLVDVWSRDEALQGLRIRPFGYASPKRPVLPFSPTRVPDHDDIAQTFATQYAVNLSAEDAVAIVTHSQGGLILQRFFAWMVSQGRASELSRIFSVVMLACPNNGSDYMRSVRRAFRYNRHPQAASLEVLDRQVANTTRTVVQRIVNADQVTDHECPIPIHVYAGDADRIVLPASAQGAFPGASTVVGNHFSILDPAAPGNCTADVVRHHVREDLARWRVAAAAEPASSDRVDEAAPANAKYVVDVRHGQGVVVGDHAQVTQTFDTRSDAGEAG